MFSDIIESANKEIGIRAYPRSIMRVIGALKQTGDFWEIVDLSDEPLPLVAFIIKKLMEKDIIKIERGEILLAKELEGEEFQWHKCLECDGRGIVIDEFKKEFENFMEIQKNRPPAIREYDQGYVTLLTTFSRVAIADQKGDLRRKEVIVLGDDDLVSIALGLTNLPDRIVVIEVDTRLIDFIRKVSKEYGLDIEAIVYDLQKPLPDEYLSRFDTFFTDPPETIEAFKAFIGRGLASLRSPRCSGYFGLTRRESSLDKWKKLQKILINDFGVVITDILHNFNVYVNWDYDMRALELSPVKSKPKTNWYKSSLYRIETLEGFKGFNEEISGDIYTDAESSTT